MKNYTYSCSISCSIVSGLVVGVVVAGAIGNTITGVLAGSLVACAGTYLASLWFVSRQAVFAAQKRMKTIMLFDGAAFAKKVAGMAGSLLATVWQIGRRVYLNEGGCRRIVYLAVVVMLYTIGLFVLAQFLLSAEEVLLEASNGGINDFVVALFKLASICVLLGFLTALLVVFFLLIGLFEGIRRGMFDDFGPFMNEWFDGVVGDNRKPFASVLYMLAIRTGNVLKMFLWVFLFAWFVLRTLYTLKIAAASATSGLLAALELGICYRFNWIAYTNANFWLAFIVVIFIGAGMGRKIYGLQLSAPGWPVIKWYKHIPKAA